MDACALMIPPKVPIYSGYSDQPDHLYYKSIYLIFPGMYNKGGGYFFKMGVLYLLDFILVGSRGHLIFIWEKGDTLYFILSTHPVFFSDWSNLAKSQLWHINNCIVYFWIYFLVNTWSIEGAVHQLYCLESSTYLLNIIRQLKIYIL